MGQSITPTSVLRFIKSYQNIKFCWGVNDCSTFIVDYMYTFTGKDYSYLAPFSWRSKREALKFVIEGGKSLFDLISQVDAVRIASFKQARTGDIVILDQKGWATAGILINGKVTWFGEHVGIHIETCPSKNIKSILRVY